MFTEADVRLMSLRPFIVGLAATLLASNPNILNEGQIATEIAALPPNWLIPLVSIFLYFSIIHSFSYIVLLIKLSHILLY